MTGRRRWSTEEILDAAAELLRTGHADSFSVRKLATVLGTDSSSLYRHFRSKTELLRAVADRVLLAAMEGHRAEGDWKQRLTDLALRVRDAFDAQPQLAAVWSRYASSGAGSRMVMEEVLQALRASGLPDAEIPTRYHRVAVLIAALIAAEAGSGAVTQEEHEQGMELFRVAVLGADPGRFPALARFARDVRPLGEDRRAAFDDILAAQLADIEASVGARRLGGGRGR
ncbi:TetR/AcrR family transcriptional regulator [Streptomyces sp. NBC_00199]|uniref:TetR/AcrR family transcriptional regulator n=1 Tax=Streptomyces sp. NBC_00199 TaxID=2975678 RepID=UPI00225B8C0C|nr:TetR/AcrR family transcriptional regulator [Streptomyces sp. NBC_00199]MCX5264762.1 TetR/AcrR family transcriptional regulator [Streptomyces sp. NBC_00199]